MPETHLIELTNRDPKSLFDQANQLVQAGFRLIRIWYTKDCERFVLVYHALLESTQPVNELPGIGFHIGPVSEKCNGGFRAC